MQAILTLLASCCLAVYYCAENIALDKPAYSPNKNANAITSNNIHWVIAERNNFPFFVVDLEGLYDIDEITLYNLKFEHPEIKRTIYTWDKYTPICDIQLHYPWNECAQPKEWAGTHQYTCKPGAKRAQYIIIAQGDQSNTVALNNFILTQIMATGRKIANAFVPEEPKDLPMPHFEDWAVRKSIWKNVDAIYTRNQIVEFVFARSSGDIALMWTRGQVFAFTGKRSKGKIAVFGFDEVFEKIMSGDPKWNDLKANLIEYLSRPGKTNRIVNAGDKFEDGDILYIHRQSKFNVDKVVEAIKSGKNNLIIAYRGWRGNTSPQVMKFLPAMGINVKSMIHLRHLGYYSTYAFNESPKFLFFHQELMCAGRSWTSFNSFDLEINFRSIDRETLDELGKEETQLALKKVIDRYTPWIAHNCPCSLQTVPTKWSWYNYNQFLFGQRSSVIQALPGVVEYPGMVKLGSKSNRIRTRATTEVDRQFIPIGGYADPGTEFSWKVLRSSKPLCNKCRISLGCQTDDLTNLDVLKRFPLETQSFPLTSEGSYSAPIGGVIYLELPAGQDITIEFTNVYKYPWVDKRDPKTLETYEQDRIDYAGVPITHYMGDSMHYCLQTKELVKFDANQLKEIIEFYDRGIKIICNYRGKDWNQTIQQIFATDVQLMSGWGHAGYPIMGYLPWHTELLDYNQVSHALASGVLHELGHNFQFEQATLKHGREVSNNVYIMLVKSLLLNTSYYNFGDGYALRNEQLEAMAKQWNQRNYETIQITYYAYLAHYFSQALTGNVWYTYTKEKIDPRGDIEKAERWILETSKASGYDLIPFHQLFSMPTTDEMVSELKALPCWMPTDQVTESATGKPIVEQILKDYATKHGKTCIRGDPKKVKFIYNVEAHKNEIRPQYIFRLE